MLTVGVGGGGVVHVVENDEPAVVVFVFPANERVQTTCSRDGMSSTVNAVSTRPGWNT